MSRCFPFPPPGYVRLSGDRYDQSLIESIKLQKEKERAKKEKKEKKKREKKEKSKDLQSSECKNLSHRKRKNDEVSNLSGKDGYYKQAKEHAAEQLEKSGLTEENGQPAFVQNFYDSDSTQDCRKRQRLETPNVSQKTDDKARVIRIRFPSMKFRDGEQPRLMPTQVKKEDTQLPQSNDANLSFIKHNDAELRRYTEMKVSSVKKEDTRLAQSNNAKLSLVKLNDAELCRYSDTKVSSVKNKDADCRPNDLKRLLVNKDGVLRNSSGLKLPSVKHEDGHIHRSRDPKLPLVKLKDATVLSTSLGKHKDAAGNVKLPLVKNKDGELHRAHDLKLSLEKHKDDSKRPRPLDEPCFSGRVEISRDSTSHTHSEGSRRVRKLERKFKDLIMSWNPPPMDIQGSVESDGLDWLLDSQKRRNGTVSQKPDVASKVSNDASAVGDSLQMRACYLPENDIYALPYVVPY